MTASKNIAVHARRSQSRSPWIGPMNILPREKQIEVVAALTEGVSIRATERLTGVNRGTIMSLGVRIGMGEPSAR